MSSYEYNQLLKFLYFEGYADSYEEAEYILEEMSDEEFEELIEAKDIPQEVALTIAGMLQGSPKFSRRRQAAERLRLFAVERNKRRLAKLQQQNEEFEELDEHRFPLTPSEKKTLERIRANIYGKEIKPPTRSARKREPEPSPQPQEPRKRTTDLSQVKIGENFESVVEYLFVEGYADTIENAELMAESISAEWVSEILESSQIQPPQEKLVTDRNMFNIPKDEQEEARQRALAKSKAAREKNNK
jgi:hypothetical protein